MPEKVTFDRGGMYTPPTARERWENRNFSSPLATIAATLAIWLVIVLIGVAVLTLLASLAALVIVGLQLRQVVKKRKESAPSGTQTATAHGTPAQPRGRRTEQTMPLPRVGDVSVPDDTASVVVEAKPFYRRHLHWIDLLRKMRLPALTLIFVLALSFMTPTPSRANVGVVVLAVLSTLVLFGVLTGLEIETKKHTMQLSASKWQKLITFAILASAVGLYAWSGEQILAELMLIGASAYWVLVRYVRWRENKWSFSVEMIMRKLDVPWFFGGKETETIPMHQVDAVSHEEPGWTGLLRLRCGILTLKTKMQEKDDEFLQNIWPLVDHEEVADFINAQLILRGRSS